MKNTSAQTWLLSLALLALVFTVQQLFAQPDGSPDGAPATTVGWLQLAITALTPIVIAGIKKWAPKIPPVVLPYIAPLLGMLIDWLTTFATGHSANPIAGAIFGGLGVWLREAYDQTKKVGKAKTTFMAIALLPLLLAGCSSLKFTPESTRLGTSVAVRTGLQFYPQYEPVIRITGEAICSASYGTNISPMAVRDAIDAMQPGPLEPQAALIIDGILFVYSGVWNALGADEALSNSPVMRAHLQASCQGIRDALPSPPMVAALRTPIADRRKYQWPTMSR